MFSTSLRAVSRGQHPKHIATSISIRRTPASVSASRGEYVCYSCLSRHLASANASVHEHSGRFGVVAAGCATRGFASSSRLREVQTEVVNDTTTAPPPAAIALNPGHVDGDGSEGKPTKKAKKAAKKEADATNTSTTEDASKAAKDKKSSAAKTKDEAPKEKVVASVSASPKKGGRKKPQQVAHPPKHYRRLDIRALKNPTFKLKKKQNPNIAIVERERVPAVPRMNGAQRVAMIADMGPTKGPEAAKAAKKASPKEAKLDSQGEKDSTVEKANVPDTEEAKTPEAQKSDETVASTPPELDDFTIRRALAAIHEALRGREEKSNTTYMLARKSKELSARLRTVSAGGMPDASSPAMEIPPAEQSTPNPAPAGKTKRAMMLESIAPLTGPMEGEIKADNVQITPVDIDTVPVPTLSYGLERVLFNPGPYQLQDLRTRVYNFDPYLGSIMPVSEFDFSYLKQYITSSKDKTLHNLAKKSGKKYIGSSSSMTGVLSQFHFLLSMWRPVNVSMLTKAFDDPLRHFTRISRAPAAIFVKHTDGVYAIDADKEFDSGNVLMSLGKSMEKLLTVSKDEFERYRKSNPENPPVEERDAPEAFHYCTSGDFMMRSQLDAYDKRLPGTGMFDLKTRAVVSIRMDAQNYTEGIGYQIIGRHGEFESYEREYFDMIRAAFLKYSLQVRLGRMDGIFVAYHNVERIQGFQYISLSEMDTAIHGQEDTALGDTEFKLSIQLWNQVMNRVTAKFPDQSLRMHYETRESKEPWMYIFAEPVTKEEIDEVQNKTRKSIEEYEYRITNGLDPNPKSTAKATEGEIEGKSIEEAIGTKDGEGKSLAEAMESADEAIAAAEAAIEAEADGVEDSAAEETSESSAIKDIRTKPRRRSRPDPNLDCSKPIVAYKLSIRNKVNGNPVVRPENFIPANGHSWTLDYNLVEVPGGPEKAWPLYKACQARRAAELAIDEEEQNPGNKGYLEKLYRISRKGANWRNHWNKEEKRHGHVVL